MPTNLTNSQIVNLILEDDMNEIYKDEEVIHMLLEKTVSTNINRRNRDDQTFGAKIADKVAKVAGSWTFIFLFCGSILLWILLNALLLLHPYDPYPYILLNLVLSCIAAIQAPVIMMSQNRQEQKDRMRAENDYKVNLKSEIIIEDIHRKLDQLIQNQETIMQRLNTTKQDNLKQEEAAK